MSNNLINECNEVMKQLLQTNKSKEVFIFDGHKYAYAFLFNEEVVQTSPLYKKFVIPADKYSALDITQKLDKSDKIAMYNVYRSGDWITLQVLIADKTILTTLDLTDNDLELSGLLN